jgi:hypothetical protein
MALFINTLGNKHLAVGICDRCHRKFPYDELRADVYNPSLRVCKDDVDGTDPYTKPPRKTEVITLRYPRPEKDLE